MKATVETRPGTISGEYFLLRLDVPPNDLENPQASIHGNQMFLRLSEFEYSNLKDPEAFFCQLRDTSVHFIAFVTTGDTIEELKNSATSATLCAHPAAIEIMLGETAANNKGFLRILESIVLTLKAKEIQPENEKRMLN